MPRWKLLLLGACSFLMLVLLISVASAQEPTPTEPPPVTGTPTPTVTITPTVIATVAPYLTGVFSTTGDLIAEQPALWEPATPTGPVLLTVVGVVILVALGHVIRGLTWVERSDMD